MIATAPTPTRAATDRPAWWPAVGETAREFAPTRLGVLSGAIPDGLRGRLYRNSAARLERGGRRNGHWFDGDGAIAAIAFDRDEAGAFATATQRFVRTAGYLEEERAGTLLYGNYGTIASGAFWNRWRRPVKHSANTSVLALPDRLLALWEGGAPYALDLEDLTTRGLDTTIAEASYSAHPKRDPRSGEIFNFGVTPGADTALRLYRHRADGQPIARRDYSLSELGISGMPMLHDFVVAGEYLVFCVPPVSANLLEVVVGLKTYGEAMLWQDDGATTILVFDRETFDLVGRGEADPWFQWHFANGFVDDAGRIVLDLARYDDFTTNEFLRQVSQGKIETEASARLERVTIEPQSGRCLASETRIAERCEFPVVAPHAVGGDAETVFVTARRPDGQPFGDLFGAIGAYDTRRDRLTVLDCGDRAYPSEPIFVPKSGQSGQSGQSGGWLVFPVFVAADRRSEVWIVDADRLEAGAVCRLALPEIVPIGFHGTWQAAT